MALVENVKPESASVGLNDLHQFLSVLQKISVKQKWALCAFGWLAPERT